MCFIDGLRKRELRTRTHAVYSHSVSLRTGTHVYASAMQEHTHVHIDITGGLHLYISIHINDQCVAIYSGGQTHTHTRCQRLYRQHTQSHKRVHAGDAATCTLTHQSINIHRTHVCINPADCNLYEYIHIFRLLRSYTYTPGRPRNWSV